MHACGRTAAVSRRRRRRKRKVSERQRRWRRRRRRKWWWLVQAVCVLKKGKVIRLLLCSERVRRCQEGGVSQAGRAGAQAG
jgi:hypothetical protein